MDMVRSTCTRQLHGFCDTRSHFHSFFFFFSCNEIRVPLYICVITWKCLLPYQTLLWVTEYIYHNCSVTYNCLFKNTHAYMQAAIPYFWCACHVLYVTLTLTCYEPTYSCVWCMIVWFCDVRLCVMYDCMIIWFFNWCFQNCLNAYCSALWTLISSL
jgi:hypothetical protein